MGANQQNTKETNLQDKHDYKLSQLLGHKCIERCNNIGGLKQSPKNQARHTHAHGEEEDSLPAPAPPGVHEERDENGTGDARHGTEGVSDGCEGSREAGNTVHESTAEA